MADQSNNGYPMISEKNWWTIRDKFKASVPSVASFNYIKTLLTLSSDASANSNVIYPMKRMGLLDDENKPTTLANDWRLDNKYKEACSIIVKNVYPSELLDLFPDSSVDRNIAKNWFMGNGVGQGAADKMVALFILLKSGEIKETKVSAPKKSTSTTNGSKKQAPSNPKIDITPPASETPTININSTSSNRPNLHIDLQIHISPDSTPEQIEMIFASMAKHFYGVDNS